MGFILLAGNEWRARALLRAQLVEEGLQVEAHESVETAVTSLSQRRTPPALLVVDVSESKRPSADLKALGAWTKFVPVWLLASRSAISEDEARRHGIEEIFFRPLDLAALVKAIHQRTGA